MKKKKDDSPAVSPLSEAFDLAAVLAYQDDAVVSRTLTDKPVGTITVFAFDQGQGMSEHATPYDAFVQILEGAMTITIDGQDQQVGKGQALIMPADHPHALSAVEKTKMLLVMIRT